MFKSNILMYGKHARYLKKYSQDKNAEEQFDFVVTDNNGVSKKTYIFSTMIQAYMVAAMLGIIEKRTAPEDRKVSTTANMFADVVMKNEALLNRIAQMMILSGEENNDDQKIKKAFSIKGDENRILQEMSAYARGGLEIIDEIFNSCRTYEDVANQILVLTEKYGILPENE